MYSPRLTGSLSSFARGEFYISLNELCLKLHDKGIDTRVVIIVDPGGELRHDAGADVLFGMIGVIHLDTFSRVIFFAVISDSHCQPAVLGHDADIGVTASLTVEAVPEYISRDLFDA